MLDRIQASIPALPPAEQRVAKLVLSDPRGFANLPVSELAERSHVSKPTVVRFCRSVGYDGLSDFKLKLAGSVNEGVPFVHRSGGRGRQDRRRASSRSSTTRSRLPEVPQRRRQPCHRARDRGAGRRLPDRPAHRVLRRRQLRHRGAGRAAQVLPPGREHHRLQRRPRAGDERHHAGAGRLRRDHLQLGPHAAT